MSAAGAVKITSTSGALTVTFTAASGRTPVVYSDEPCTTTASLPATITSGTTSTFYFASRGTYTISVKNSAGIELAGPGNATRTVGIESPGAVAALSYDTRIVSKVDGDSGTSGDNTEETGTYVAFTTKRATFSLNAPNSTGAAVSADYLQRTIASLPVATTRWRLKYANRDLLTDTNLTTPLTLSHVYVGVPVYASTGDRRWTGAFSATPTLALASGGTAIPTDGTDYVSPWVTDPALQFAKNVKTLLSWAIQITNSGTGFASSPTLGCNHNGSGTSNVAALAPAVTLGVSKVFGDVRLEVEYTTGEPVGLFVGDSITAGRGTTADPGSTQIGALPSEAWPNVAARNGGFVPVNLAVGASGLTLSPTLYDTAAHLWATRADLTTTVPDFAVIALGTNDLASATVASMQAAFITLLDAVRALGIPRVYGATIIPRASTGWGWLTANVAAGDASCVVNSNETGAPTALGTMVVGNGAKAETVTIASRTANAPWTVNLSGTFAQAHTGSATKTDLTEVCYFGSGGVAVWAEFNSWLRGMPGGITGVIDFAQALEIARRAPYPDTRYMGTDMLHPIRGGYQRLGEAAAVIVGSRRP